MTICNECKQEITTQIGKTSIVKELGIEIEIEIHDKGKKLSEIKIPKGWRLLTINEVIYLYNNYEKELNLSNTWEFVEYPFEKFKTKYVAGFVVDSDRADLGCFWDPQDSYASLGVRFCRDLEEDVKK